jgi:hypothetical protein
VQRAAAAAEGAGCVLALMEYAAATDYGDFRPRPDCAVTSPLELQRPSGLDDGLKLLGL